MKKTTLLPLVAAAFVLPLFAQTSPSTESAPTSWHAQSLVGALGYMAAFALTGTLLAIVSFKLFDKCTPGELHREIIENKNVAAGLVAGAVILGVCLIIAASMIG
jgi:uncharacterized membrane protein YjfL (UPF0719 family)